MKASSFLLVGIITIGSVSHQSNAQGDWAVYDTFSRYSPSVYSIRVEIPKKYILKRHKELIQQFQDLQDQYSDVITGGSDTLAGPYMFQNVMNLMRRKLDVMKDQMLANNRVRGAAFAISPHYMVTLSTVVNSATLGGTISIKDDYQWLAHAQVVGTDTFTGISVLHVKDATLTNYIDLHPYLNQPPEQSDKEPHYSPTLPLASYLISIQRPYELPASPFTGVIGGYNRILGLFEIEKYIQTEIPFYPGNEGSPVFSPSGQLVGMMATEFHIGRFPGISFLIPADIIADSALSIMKTGKRERGWISGVGLGQDGEGIIIKEVVPQSPAAKAGLRAGDQILGVNGVREKRVWNLIDLISKTQPNQTIQLEVKRGFRLYRIEMKTSLRSNRKKLSSP